MAKIYPTAEEMRAAFIKEGWNETITLTKVPAEEIKRIHGCVNLKEDYYYIMNATGNVFRANGKVLLYNIKAKGE